MSSTDRAKLVHWIAVKVMPHESAVRAWLARSLVSGADIDDLIQEAYCRLSTIASIEDIERPDAYFFQVVRNLLREQLRRSNLVRIDASVAMDTLPLGDDGPSPERIAASRDEWRRVQMAMRRLPARCRSIIELRKIHGFSQRDIASRLGVSESIVENDAVKGMRLILKYLGQSPTDTRTSDRRADHERSRNRR